MADENRIDLGDITVTDNSDNHEDNPDINEGTTFAIDEDDIKIGDKRAPIIMLFGPPTSGKSMTLVRLARYLRKQGYTVKADPTIPTRRVVINSTKTLTQPKRFRETP